MGGWIGAVRNFNAKDVRMKLTKSANMPSDNYQYDENASDL